MLFSINSKLFNLIGMVTSIHHTLHTKIIHQHWFSHFHLHISYNRRKSNSQFPDRLKCVKLQLAKIYVCRVVQLALYWNSWSNIWNHSCGHLPRAFSPCAIKAYSISKMVCTSKMPQCMILGHLSMYSEKWKSGLSMLQFSIVSWSHYNVFVQHFAHK